MAEKTPHELMNDADELEKQAVALDDQAAAALIHGKPADHLIKDARELRARADALRRAALAAAKLQEQELAAINEAERKKAVAKLTELRELEAKQSEAIINTWITLIDQYEKIKATINQGNGLKEQYQLFLPPLGGSLVGRSLADGRKLNIKGEIEFSNTYAKELVSDAANKLYYKLKDF